MSEEFIENKTFKGENYSERVPKKTKYENCTFLNCIFSNADLSDVNFSECEFENCDLSMARLKNTVFREVKFSNCKLLGLHFGDCNNILLSFNFEDCLLSFSSFYKLDLKNIHFKNCVLEEVEFVETSLTNSIFDNCNLSKARFENTILNDSDFRTSFNFSIDPEVNSLQRTKFSIPEVIGLLDKYNIIIE